jgi:outer membrane receptor protein involved in Fe transport
MKNRGFKKSLLTLAVGGALFGSAGAFAAGSNVNGTIQGVFQDGSGTEVSQIDVTIINKDNGARKTVSTGNDGAFKVSMPAGNYTVQSRKEGYMSSAVESVQVRLGSTSNLVIPITLGDIEEVIVQAKAYKAIQTGVAESALNISLEEVARLPVPRAVEAVALLAPGVVLGDTGFGEDKNLVSFGGASVGENAYFIDGLNVTNFRNGLGGSSVPFEFYEQFQIKTGGYSAEFGRSLGGVLNAVTKKGSNDFHYGVVSYMEPESGQSNSPDTRRNDGSLYDLNSKNKSSSFTTDLYASGAIIEDTLFFYALVETSETTELFNTRGAPDTQNDREIKDDFYGVNLLWNITDNHSLSYVQFTDERVRENQEYEYNTDTKSQGEARGVLSEFRGGENKLIRYDGSLTDTFNMSVLYGENEYNLTTVGTTDQECPYVVDTSVNAIPGNTSTFPGCEANSRAVSGGDKREAFRMDFEWFLGDHTIRFGYDKEENASTSEEFYSGTNFRTTGQGVYYRYYTASPGTGLSNGGIVPDANGDGSDVNVVRYRLSEVAGDFAVEGTAVYIEDTWDVTDQLTLSAGLRSETFENFNSDGETFIKIDDQLGPRLGASYNFNDDRNSRVYANWGRYYMPIASNTNVRLSGGELGIQRYFVFDGDFDPRTVAPNNIDAEGVPTSAEIGTTQVTANGLTPDSAQLSDVDLDPMYQDEIILGFETNLNDDWSVGIRYTNRDLKSHIDDVLIDYAVDAMGYAHTGDAGGYVLANPGSDITIPYDRYDTGVLEMTTFAAADLQYETAERTYESVEFTAERAFDGVWSVKASYLWSESEGNTEGYVKSDNAQDDAGITQDFDEYKLMDGAYGFLPNDRTHQFKVYGNYQLSENLLLGFNASLLSGRPINSFGTGHPDGAPIYGDTYYLMDPNTGEFTHTPRGSRGRTSWVAQFDANAVYSMDVAGGELELRAEIFNLLDAEASTEVYEFGELSEGVADPAYGINQQFQKPRTIRLGASLRF